MSRERRIAHLDMDAFYASVELLRRPELRGRPLAIGGRGDPTRRGVVTTATYEAREFGIHSGMALRRALELCPDCIFLPTDFDAYRKASRVFKQAIARIAPAIEDRGIDEVYVDLTDVDGIDRERGATLGRRIKAAVRDASGLSCSIGIAPNKLIAKIASDLDKPDGLTIIEADEIATRLWPLPARRINGIGPKASERLHAIGIDTIGDLAAADPLMLVRRFGNGYGRWLGEVSRGRDDRPVVTHSEPVSRSRETTFERDMHPKRDWDALAHVLAGLCRQLGADLDARGYRGRTIGVKVRFDDFRVVTRDLTIDTATADAGQIRRVAFDCLARIPLERRLRLIGVRIAKLDRDRRQDVPTTTSTPGVREPRVGETPDLFDTAALTSRPPSGKEERT
ncbi:MAG: DNA polymerase IV [Burkholderiaceae bacterium]|nr:DNA polymerase IV [Burkholderiaceae bacterium]